MDIKALSRFAPRLEKRYISVLMLLVLIVATGFWFRAMPARFDELQAIDPFYLYRITEYVYENNWQLPAIDMMRHNPFGSNPTLIDPPLLYYLPNLLFFAGAGVILPYASFWSLAPALFGFLVACLLLMRLREKTKKMPGGASKAFTLAVLIAIPLITAYATVSVVTALSVASPSFAPLAHLEFAILFPALMGAVSVFFMFFLGRELFGTRAGLFAAFFLALLPAFITRTSAGFFEKEGVSGPLIILTAYLFIKAYRTGSWKLGLFSGISLAAMFQGWGGSQYFYLLISGFVFIMLLINRYDMRLFKSFVPLAVVSLLGTQVFPFHMGLNAPVTAIMILVLSITLIRYFAERFKLIKENQMAYITPAITITILVAFLISAMFIDQSYSIIVQILGIFYGEKSIAGTTVAEQMGGSWADVTSSLGTSFSSQMLGPLSSISPLLAANIFVMIGFALLCYRFYRKMDWIYIFLFMWVTTSIFSVFGMIRLLFLIGPPVAIFSGFAVSEIITYASKAKVMKDMGTWRKKINYVSVPLVALIALLLIVNMSNAYVYSISMGPSFNQYWDEAMDYLATETPEGSNILSWWDFGYWFQTRGERPSVSDGGGVGPRYDIARWFMNDARNWSDETCGFEVGDMACNEWLMDRYHVDYILMDYSLPAKYGAISKIGSSDKETVGMLQFQQTGMYPQGNRSVYEFRAGEYSIWLPFDNEGRLAGTPMFLVSQGDQYVSRAYINDICTTSGIVTVGTEAQNIGGCVAITNFGIFYVPEVAKNNVFTNLMFMDGYGLPVEKVFDNTAIRIYRVIYGSESAVLGEGAQSSAEDFLDVSSVELPL